MPKYARQSGLELLRIVSMFMVLAVHIDGASLGLPMPSGDCGSLTSRHLWQLAVESFAIIGVNCFTMISGYFGIRLRLRSMLMFVGECLFYSVGIYLLFVATGLRHFSWTGFADSLMVLSHSDLWYIPAYFGLCLLAPFINAGCDGMSRHRLMAVTGVFLLFNVWCGWWWNGQFNPTGYTLIQLVLIYMLGRVVSRFIPVGTHIGLKGVFVSGVCYFIATACIFMMSLYIPSVKAFAYNSPFVIVATVAFFVIFLGVRFKSRIVNYLALSAFAVYLVHKNPLIWGNYMRPWVIKVWESCSLVEFTLYVLAFMVVCYLFVALIDTLRCRIFDYIETLVNLVADEVRKC